MTSSNGNIFRVAGPLCEEFTGHRWIPLTKASDAELWFFCMELCIFKPKRGIIPSEQALQYAVFIEEPAVKHTVKPVCNDHPYNKIYNMWFIQ